MGASASVKPTAERRDSILSTEAFRKMFSKQASFNTRNAYSICEYEDRMFRIMTSDVKVRELFVKYIKLGQWMDVFREAPEASLMESLMSTLKLPEFVKPTVIIPSDEDLETTTSVSVSSARDNAHKRTPTSSHSTHGAVKIAGIPLSRGHSLKSMRSGGDSTKDLHEGARLSSHPFTPVQHGASWSSMATSSNRTAHSTGANYETGFREPFHTREMLSLLFVCLYPLFLESRIYQAHFQCRRNIAITGSQQFQLSDFANLVSVDSDDYVGNSADEQLRKDGSGHAMSLFLEAANAFDTDQITAILANPLWLHVHRPSEIVANAHVAVCVFSASFNQPVIYVNKAYEKLTGYAAKEVIGNPSRLAQETRVASGETDTSESPSSLTEALTSGKPTKLEMHGKTKGGKDINNYMILTPVFEPNSEILSYVVCVQFDTAEKDVTVREMQVARDVLAIMPYLLLH